MCQVLFQMLTHSMCTNLFNAHNDAKIFFFFNDAEKGYVTCLTKITQLVAMESRVMPRVCDHTLCS